MENLLQSFVDNFFAPELIRRQKQGELPKPYALHAAQYIMYKGMEESVFRFNGDCKFTIVTDEDLEPIDRTKLTRETDFTLDLHPDDGDAGHISILLLADGGWTGAFSCIYNREASREHLAAADEFAEAAIQSLRNKNMRAFVDTMFSACELISKAFILSDLSPQHAKGGGSHSLISSKVNLETKTGTVPEMYSALHNKYKNLRNPARYLKGSMNLTHEEAETDFKTLGMYRMFVARKIK